MDVRRERDDEDAALAQRHQRPERLPHEPLRAGHAGALGVGRVAEQQIDTLVAELGEPADVRLEAVDGRVVELPVARVHDAARSRLEHDRDAVRDRVRDADEVEGERADLDLLAGLGLLQPRRGGEAVLVELRLDQPERQLRPDHDVAVDLAEEVRQPADVILVAVREHDRADAAVAQVADVGEDEVDAEVLVAREGEPGVHDHDVVAVLVDGHVLADLAEAAQRNDAKAHRRSVCAVLVPRRRRAQAGRAVRGSRGRGRARRASPRRAAAGARRPRGRAGSAPT